MIKIYKDIKSGRVYINEDSYSKNEQFQYTRTDDLFSMYKLNGGFMVISDMNYQDFSKRDGSSFVDANEFEDLMKEIVGLDLRVYRALPNGSNPLISDFTILGFSKEAPHYDRGRKTKAQYKDQLNGHIIVEKVFTDVLHSSTGRLKALQVTFNWYNESGQIGLTKTEIVKNFNKSEAETEERKRRERSIDFLVSEARDTPNEPYITMLIAHYGTEIAEYKDNGSSTFSNAISNETDVTILQILNARVPFTSDNTYIVPIKESILYQIGALDEAGLLATLEVAT